MKRGLFFMNSFTCFCTVEALFPVGNFVYRFTKSPEIQVDMLIKRTTTVRAPSHLCTGRHGQQTSLLSGPGPGLDWPQGSVIQMLSGL